MKIDTTINVKKEIIERIDMAAEECAVSRTRMVSLMLKRIMREKSADKNRFSRVKYQKRDKSVTWKRPHVYLEHDLYEKIVDARKLHKMSVSFILLVAYNRYFDLIVNELKNGEDTDRQLRNYICIAKRYREVFSYTVFWDFPSEEELIKVLE